MDSNDYLIRIPLNMVQMTDKRGQAWPVAFDWETDDGEVIRVEIDRIRSCVPFAEQKSGTVGDRYECIINGKTEYLYFTIRAPRKWFKLKPVTEEEYKRYYRLPGEKNMA
ncbi:MAG: hypothetical protein LBN43_00525 [Oscillospiraceae bacterium]|jgi:hypothetical protein|nr:hypothetical protein [Oscillospiraceae bacterium]